MNVIRILEAMAVAIEGRERATPRHLALIQREARSRPAVPSAGPRFRLVALRDLEGPRRRAS
jgi:hypothetical protein